MVDHDDANWLKPAWEQFRARLKSDRLAHALLLQGPGGIAKSQLARKIASSLLCLKTQNDEACGACRSCNLLHGGAHPEQFLVAPEEDSRDIKIKQIRGLIEHLSLTTTISSRKVALINPAERMNPNSANALLKTLEEPPGSSVIILVSSDPTRLPVTIRSRTQSLLVAPPSLEEGAEWLERAGNLTPEQASQALTAAGGAPLRALDYQCRELVPAYFELKEQLHSLRSTPDGVAAASAQLRDYDPDALWLWLSQSAGDRLRSADRGASHRGLLADLQKKADRNRNLVKTAVRGDLLLRDWLIEWSLPGRS